MSLRVWLPLTKDLRNQGLDDIPIFQLVSDNSFVNNGKIGEKALNIIKQQRILSNTSCMTGKKQMSYAFWVKVNTVWTTQWLDGIAWYSTDGTSAFYSRQEFYNNCTKVGTWFKGSPNSLSGYDFNPEKWTHIAATFDYNIGEAKFYLNGELKGTSNGLSTSDYCRGDFYIGDTGVDILENDVRIYDHALSPLEVKQISQGLILHYPLNRNGWGQENLLKNSYGTIIDKRNNALNSRTEYFAWDVGSSYTDINTSTQVVISFDLEMYVNDITSYSGQLLVYNTNNKGPIQLTNVSYYFKNEYSIGDTIKKRIYLSTTLVPRNDANKTSNYIEFYTGYGSNNFYKISNVKLEKGSLPTPWCPNSSDTLATTLGLNDNIQYDTSGYGNNGTKVGIFSYNSDTPKYNVSTSFNGSAKIERDSLMGEVYTLSCWAKTIKNKSTSQMMVVDSNSQIGIAFYNGTIIGVYGTTRSTGSKSTLSGSNYKENEWNHFVVVKTSNDGKRNIYCNGELLTPVSDDYWSSASNNFGIGAINTSTPCYFYGEISDVRAYVTALSADDVKSLYQNSAYIDNQGNIYGAVYEEA